MAPRRIAVFGSSSIYGTADAERGGFVNRFRLWYETISPGNRVYNLGIWGEQTRQLSSRILTEAPRRRPQLIMVYPGFNDCCRQGSVDSPTSVSLSDYCETVGVLIANAQSIAETIVITGFPFDQTRTTPYKESDSYYTLGDAEAYTDALVDVANSRNALVLDFFASFRDNDISGLLAADGLHCNAQGHELMFIRTRDFFRDAFLAGE